jgi:starch synthase (maltosyl-transferring)
MRSTIPSQGFASNKERFAPKIMYFDPLNAGPRQSWPRQIKLARDLGFDYLLSAPLFAPGSSGDRFISADHERAHPAIDPKLSADGLASELSIECRANDLELYLDLAIGRVSDDAAIAQAFPHWFRKASSSPIDPRISRRDEAAAYIRVEEDSVADEVVGYWTNRLERLARAGVTGFCCVDPEFASPVLYARLISAVTRVCPQCRFLVWTPGLDWSSIGALRGVGFAGAFSSVAWWDGRAPWLAEEHNLLRGLGAVISCPEVPFGPRVESKTPDLVETRLRYRHLLLRAAATGDGIMVPMGTDAVAHQGFDDETTASGTRYDTDTFQNIRTADIREATALSDELAGRRLGSEMRIVSPPDQPVTAIFRSSSLGQSETAAVILINTDLQHEGPLPISLDPLPPAARIAAVADQAISADRDSSAPLGPGEVRVIALRPGVPIRLQLTESQAAKIASLPRVVIDDVTPAVENGRFPTKRVVGDDIAVEANVFSDGHELLAVELIWRAADEKGWRRQPMQLLGNDRWRATLACDRIGRYEYTIEAWWDRFGTFCHDLEIKRRAGADLGIEIVEGREHLEKASGCADRDEQGIITAALRWLADASPDASADILLAQDLREVMYGAEERQFLFRCKPTFALDVERPQAAFAAWYEMFPRSATDSSGRHGTFRDVIARLPAIRDMGFDVLYMPPIHPIGWTHRKGKNNSPTLEPGDVGSPYAIGSAQGGHDAIHAELGTIADFRRLRDAASAHGLELALDFAIQCSPDHPWLKEHPEWFRWRPDGSVRYAENPPKKYQDIVNVDFYAPNAYPALWQALRDIVLYWRSEGVRLFRVDNPHTKPLPFWEWLILQVRGRYPDVIFLSEAFTRPKIMYRLAMSGFSQSYTYFTWRNTKQELTEYFTELTTTDVKDYFRPHLFVNTPDINSFFLQTSGRPGFLIRAALAATLSGLWGIYSGFELCESAALPGREEYLDSEKYQIKVRDFEAPGNITAEISKLNYIRRTYPALQSHLGLTFYPVHHDQVVCYGKMSAGCADMILVAVQLDPFHGCEATIEVPLWEWDLPDSASVAVRDLMNDTEFTWHGKLQRIRLDPQALPFAIWHISPVLGG